MATESRQNGAVLGITGIIMAIEVEGMMPEVAR